MVRATDKVLIDRIGSKLAKYQQDPVGYMINVLGMNPDYIWPKMRQVAEAIRDHQKVAIPAGHSVSKTYSMGRIVPWFKTCYQPSTVITTAPSDNLVKEQLWREIHAGVAGAVVPLGGTLNRLLWDYKPTKEVLDTLTPAARLTWEKNFAIGFSTSPDSATEHCTKMQGWHNEHLLVVIDEACGIAPQIWRTILEALIIDEQCKVVAIGNMTDPNCDFARACKSSDPQLMEGPDPYMSDEGWYVVRISAMDTPNYKQNRRVIPGLAGRAFVDGIIRKYGPNGDGTRIRVLGLPPTFKEGTYYGRHLAKAIRDKRVGNYKWEEGTKVYTFSDTGDMNTATIFAQFLRHGIRIIDCYWDNEGKGVSEWAKVLQSKPYVYGGHFVGPELAAGTPGRFQTGKSTMDIAAELGFAMQPIDRHAFDDGIQAGRDTFGKLEINKTNGLVFIQAASGYGKKKNMALSTDDNPEYHDHPAKTWHRHMMDAYRHLAYAYMYEQIGGEILGYPGAYPIAHPSINEEVDGVYDLLELG